MPETNLNTSNSLAADMVPVMIRDKMLMLAEKNLVFWDLGEKVDLPEGNGKTIQFTRYERLALPTSPLTESETPTAIPLTTSVVQAVVEQWGALVSMSDVAQLTIKHPVLRVAQQRLSTQHDETTDREVQKTLLGSSNVSFANQRASRAALVAGDFLTADDLRREVARLRADGAPTRDGSYYVGVLDPYVEMDLTRNADFLQAAQYQNLRALMANEIGTWMGIRWRRSNNIPIITRVTAGIAIAAQTTLNNFTGFGAGTTVQAKVTKLDPNTGFETSVFDTAAITNGAAFRVQYTLSADGVYNIYTSLEAGAAGTETFQTRVVRAGTNVVVLVAKGLGTGVVVTTGNAPEIVVTATGALAPPNASAAGNVHLSWIFGREAFGVVSLAGLSTYLTPASPSDSDPLVQRRKAGWKQIFKTVIMNPVFFRRLESLSNFN